MTEKQARRLGVGCAVYHIVRCLHGIVTHITFHTVSIQWEQWNYAEVIGYDQMQDIERKERYGK